MRSSDSHWRDAHQTRQLRLAGVSEGVAVLTTVDVREQNHDAKISERLGGLLSHVGHAVKPVGTIHTSFTFSLHYHFTKLVYCYDQKQSHVFVFFTAIIIISETGSFFFPKLY